MSSTKYGNKIKSVLSLSSKALYCTSSKCTNGKTTPRMVSSKSRPDRKINFKMNQIAPEHSRSGDSLENIEFRLTYAWSFTTDGSVRIRESICKLFIV